MADEMKIERRPWQGPYSESMDSEGYLSDAIDPLDSVWRWDDPVTREACIGTFNKDQLALWSIWNVDGQICNGGFTQVFYNSYGELAEEALRGFQRFKMNKYADPLEEAFGKFTRPIPIARRDRLTTPESTLEVDLGTTTDKGLHDMRRVSEMFHKSSQFFDGLEKIYFNLRHSQGDFDKVLCRIRDEREESFFVIDVA